MRSSSPATIKASAAEPPHCWASRHTATMAASRYKAVVSLREDCQRSTGQKAAVSNAAQSKVNRTLSSKRPRPALENCSPPPAAAATGRNTTVNTSAPSSASKVLIVASSRLLSVTAPLARKSSAMRSKTAGDAAMDTTPTARATDQSQPSTRSTPPTSASVSSDSPRLCKISHGWRSSQGKDNCEAASSRLTPTATSSSSKVLPCSGHSKSPNPSQPPTSPTSV